VWLEGLGKLKKSTSLGLDPATFQLVAVSQPITLARTVMLDDTDQN
jgi:hypothetical protein